MSELVEQKLTVVTDAENKPLNYEVYLKPTLANEFYRFRLLWFTDSTERKVPFVERFIHGVWTKNGDKNTLTTIACPTSAHIKKHWAGNAYDDCPICRFAGNNYIAMKESNYKDQVAKDNNKMFKRKFQGIVPVYVVNDPVYDANNGKFKCVTVDNQEIFEKFKALVIERNAASQVFNGVNALDFLVRVEDVAKVGAAGTDHEFTYTRKEIVQMGFSKKPYDIPAINKEAIDAFPFGQLYYNSPTLDELKAFYKEFCLHAVNDDVDMDSLSDVSAVKPATDKPESKAESKPESKAKAKPVEVEEADAGIDESDAMDISSIASDSIDEDAEGTSGISLPSDSEGAIDIDDLLDGVGL